MHTPFLHFRGLLSYSPKMDEGVYMYVYVRLRDAESKRVIKGSPGTLSNEFAFRFFQTLLLRKLSSMSAIKKYELFHPSFALYIAWYSLSKWKWSWGFKLFVWAMRISSQRALAKKPWCSDDCPTCHCHELVPFNTFMHRHAYPCGRCMSCLMLRSYWS